MSIAPGFGTWEQRYHNAQWEAQQLREQLATVTAERDELVAALTKIATTNPIYRIGVDVAKETLAKLGADKTGAV